MTNITVKDVAKYCNVSPCTVSRAIKSPEQVKPDTLKMILEAIEKLGYVPNYAARVLRTAQSRAVGVTLYDINNPFLSKLVMSLERTLADYNYRVLITFNDPKTADDYDAINRLASLNVDLQIFIPTKADARVQHLPGTQARTVLQLFKNVYDNMDSLVIDDAYGTELATRHLLELGHKKILFLDFDQIIKIDRASGYREAFVRAGHEVNKGLIRYVPEGLGFDELVGVVRKIIADAEPTAIIATTQLLCSATLMAVKQLSLTIGKDISLIAYDDSDTNKILGITAIDHPFDDMITQITSWIVHKITDEAAEDNISEIKLKPFLITRSSTSFHQE